MSAITIKGADSMAAILKTQYDGLTPTRVDRFGWNLVRRYEIPRPWRWIVQNRNAK